MLLAEKNVDRIGDILLLKKEKINLIDFNVCNFTSCFQILI